MPCEARSDVLSNLPHFTSSSSSSSSKRSGQPAAGEEDVDVGVGVDVVTDVNIDVTGEHSAIGGWRTMCFHSGAQLTVHARQMHIRTPTL